MPRPLTIMFLVLAPILASVPYIFDSATGDTVNKTVVWLTAILLVVTGSYYAWIKPKNRNKRWLILPVLVAVFIIPLSIMMVKVLVVKEPPSEVSIAIEKLNAAEKKIRGDDFYTLASYADTYESTIKDLSLESFVDWGPGFMFRGDDVTIFHPLAVNDFPPLALFYGESRGLWATYLSLRGDSIFDTYILDALRRKYETNIPELDAVLFLWGKESNLETDEAMKIVIAMMKYYDISPTMVDSLRSTKGGKGLWDMQEKYGNQWLNLEGEAANRVNTYGWRQRFGY